MSVELWVGGGIATTLGGPALLPHAVFVLLQIPHEDDRASAVREARARVLQEMRSRKADWRTAGASARDGVLSKNSIEP